MFTCRVCGGMAVLHSGVEEFIHHDGWVDPEVLWRKNPPTVGFFIWQIATPGSTLSADSLQLVSESGHCYHRCDSVVIYFCPACKQEGEERNRNRSFASRRRKFGQTWPRCHTCESLMLPRVRPPDEQLLDLRSQMQSRQVTF